jgi:Ca2+-binding RTX toxin-like protein
MGRRHLRRRLIATAVLAVALVGASQLYAAVIAPHGAGPKTRLVASGALSLSNSGEGGAIFTASNLGPGHSTEGSVTITNTGSAPGSLTLSASELSDSPGTYGGTLSEVLDLSIAESGTDTTVYSGKLDSMPEQQLGPLAPGDSHTYRFSVGLPDSGNPTADWSGENIYQRASSSIGYEWTLTEAEGGDPEPPEAAPGSPPLTPPGSPPPTTQERTDEGPLTGTSHADTLVGTAGDDLIYGLGGADRIFGMGGADSVFGGSGADRIHGDAGNDRLWGGPGRDHIYGGSGSDVIFARDGERDFIDCGRGRDVAFVDQHDVTRGCEVVRRLYGRLFVN